MIAITVMRACAYVKVGTRPNERIVPTVVIAYMFAIKMLLDLVGKVNYERNSRDKVSYKIILVTTRPLLLIGVVYIYQ